MMSKNVKLSDETYEALRGITDKGETYNHRIKDLIDYYQENCKDPENRFGNEWEEIKL